MGVDAASANWDARHGGEPRSPNKTCQQAGAACPDSETRAPRSRDARMNVKLGKPLRIVEGAGSDSRSTVWSPAGTAN